MAQPAAHGRGRDCEGTEMVPAGRDAPGLPNRPQLPCERVRQCHPSRLGAMDYDVPHKH